MPKFNYTAVDKQGKQRQGTADSASEASLSSLLSKQELRPVSIKKVTGGNILGSLTKKKVKTKDITVFTRQLATMINAGVPLVRSLATLQGQTENPTFKTHISEISKDVESGNNFADSLAKHPSVFSPVYVNMVSAGEAGGILDEILKKLATQQEKDQRIKTKFKSAMTYPAVLIGITTIVFVGLMTVAVPKIGKIIKDLTNGGELPVMTRTMLSISNFLTKFWYIHISVLFLTVFFLTRYLRTPEGRHKRDVLLLKTPAIKTIIIKIAVARFSRIFASLMSAGVSVIDAIEITGKAIGNSVLEAELNAAAKEVANGKQFSEPLANSKFFPPIVSQMLAIGEETGQTDSVLLKVADFYEEEVDAAVDGLSSILEPVMIVVMGAMVGLIAASVIGPISNLSNQI